MALFDEQPDSGFEFLDFPSSVSAGEPAPPDMGKEAGILDAYSQAVTNVISIVGLAVVRIQVKKVLLTIIGDQIPMK
jgi:hypothetical protein